MGNHGMKFTRKNCTPKPNLLDHLFVAGSANLPEYKMRKMSLPIPRGFLDHDVYILDAAAIMIAFSVSVNFTSHYPLMDVVMIVDKN
jgi:hypothetical protein